MAAEVSSGSAPADVLSAPLAGGPPPGDGALYELLRLAEAVIAAASQVRPGVTPAEEAARAAAVLARLAKAATYLSAALAARAVDQGQHRRSGFGSGDEWLAAEAGVTVAQARSQLGLVGALGTMPSARAAAEAGELSFGQIALLREAEEARPGAGDALVEVARQSQRAELKQAARKVIEGSLTAADLSRARHRARFFRSWVDHLGMTCFQGALPPEVGQVLVSRVEAGVARARRAARDEPGRPEAPAFPVLAADALVDLVVGPGDGCSVPPAPARAEVVFVVSYEAYRRGHTHLGEPCHLVGAGPVTLEQAAAAVPDAFIKAVVAKEKEICSVAHLGRHLPAEVRTALALGPPPGFEGARCAVAGCDRRYGLEVDHIVPLSESGPTRYDNLQMVCGPHHWEKTERDRANATRPWPVVARARPAAADSRAQGSEPPAPRRPTRQTTDPHAGSDTPGTGTDGG